MSKGRKILWGFIALLLIGFLVATFFRNLTKTQNTALETKKLKPNAAPASESIKVIYQSSRTPLLPKKEDRISTACSEYFASIRGVDFRLVHTFPPKSPPFPKSDTCKDLPASLGVLNSNYLQACEPLTKPMVEMTLKLWSESLPVCIIALFNFRAQLSHFLTRTIPIEDIVDPRILLDKMMATMGGTDYLLNEKLAQRLFELEPTLIPAAEMITLSRFMQAVTQASGKPTDKKWEELENSLKKLIEMGALDSKQALEWELMIQLSRNSDPEEGKRSAEKIGLQYPDWSLPVYYKAWAMYNAEEVSGARQVLESERKKNPSDERLKEALEKINKKDPHPFRSNFSVSFPTAVFD